MRNVITDDAWLTIHFLVIGVGCYALLMKQICISIEHPSFFIISDFCLLSFRRHENENENENL